MELIVNPPDGQLTGVINVIVLQKKTEYFRALVTF